MPHPSLKKTLLNLLEDINDPRQAILLKIYLDHAKLFHSTLGSSHNHQAWDGGYADHIAECLRVNEVVYDALSEIRPLTFSKASGAIALFFHDIEKPFKYGPKTNAECLRWQTQCADKHNGDWEAVKYDILDDFEFKYGLTFTDEEQNALKYTHGEGNDHRKDHRVASPLAAHVHHCDNTSARIWFDDGKGLSVNVSFNGTSNVA